MPSSYVALASCARTSAPSSITRWNAPRSISTCWYTSVSDPAGRRVPDRISLRPSISSPISVGSMPASSAVTIARGGSSVYATSTAGMKPTRRRAMPARSNTSPNS